jgi:very-short-patch-repair endonuclease
MRGAYVMAGQASTHGELIRAVRCVVPPTAVLGGRSAAWAHGVEVADNEPVEIVLPPDQRVRPRPGLIVRGDRLIPGEAVWTPLGLATSPARTAFDLGRRPRLHPEIAVVLLEQLGTGQRTDLPDRAAFQMCEAVWQVDAVLRQTRESVAAVDALAKRHPGVRGLRALRSVLLLTDPRAESRPESIVRSRILLAGLPRPTPQYPIHGGDSGFVARVDLAWPSIRLAAEYDGAYHDEQDQFMRDRTRSNLVQLAGWRTLHLDVRHLRDPATMIALLRSAIHRPLHPTVT